MYCSNDHYVKETCNQDSVHAVCFIDRDYEVEKLTRHYKSLHLCSVCGVYVLLQSFFLRAQPPRFYVQLPTSDFSVPPLMHIEGLLTQALIYSPISVNMEMVLPQIYGIES